MFKGDQDSRLCKIDISTEIVYKRICKLKAESTTIPLCKIFNKSIAVRMVL
jgi:hypothetical protein